MSYCLLVLFCVSSLMSYWYTNIKEFVPKTNQYVKKHYDRFLDTIDGVNIIVKIDESKFYKRKYNRWRKLEGVWVLGMVERTACKRIVLILVKDRNSNTLKALLKKKHFAPWSIIFKNKWKGYLSCPEGIIIIISHYVYFLLLNR